MVPFELKMSPAGLACAVMGWDAEARAPVMCKQVYKKDPANWGAWHYYGGLALVSEDATKGPLHSVVFGDHAAPGAVGSAAIGDTPFSSPIAEAMMMKMATGWEPGMPLGALGQGVLEQPLPAAKRPRTGLGFPGSS